MEMGDQLVTHPGAGLGVALQYQVDFDQAGWLCVSEADGGSVGSCDGTNHSCYNSWCTNYLCLWHV